jgi:hypothetical protein
VVVAAGPTVWVTGSEVLDAKLVVAPNVATTGWLPTGRAAVVQVATPAASGRAPQPVISAPSAPNATVPDGVPAPLATPAVKVTGSPATEAGVPDTTVVVVAALPTD